MSVVDDSFGNPKKLEEKAAGPLAGGIANMGYQCGMIWGAALAAGAQAYQQYGATPQAEVASIVTTQNLLESFRTRTKDEINCLEISHLNMQGKTEGKEILKFFLKGGPIGCFRLAAKYAKDAYREVDLAQGLQFPDAPAIPVSCAAALARKMGASEEHAVMASGFAGGIGLSGGACGALGAAIWFLGVDRPVEIEGFSYSGTWINDVIERFLESSDYEFECSAITGCKFADVNEHAAYISDGGCAKIIETLATVSVCGKPGTEQ